MFGRDFRHGGRRRDEEEYGPDHESHGGRHGHGRGPLGRWFGPGRGGPPGRGGTHGHGGHRGRGGPFGDDPFGEREGGRRRQRRGDIKFALLELLAEQPRHGYELIKELEKRYGGFYRPSPGSVYPTLQLLEDEGHLASETVSGKRVYTVTESGLALLQERRQSPAAGRTEHAGGFHPEHGEGELHELRESAMALMAAVMQVARHGTVEQVREVKARLATARRDVYGVLASGENPDEQ